MDLPGAIRLSDQYLVNEEADVTDPPLDSEGRVDKDELEARRGRKRANDFITIADGLIHKFLDKVDSLAESPEESDAWLKTLQRGAENARAEDTYKVSVVCVPQSVNSFTGDRRPNPPLNESRENRGLKHDVCGFLLCPVELDWDDPEVCGHVRDYEAGFELGPTARALYSDYTGNPKNIDAGYLKSKLLVKTYKFIFTSPSSAKSVAVEGSDDENLEPPSTRRRTSQSSSSRRSVRKDIATTLNMNNKVTPRSIAYAAVQVRIPLYSGPAPIIDYFEDNDDAELERNARELLKWWNSQIFPQAKRSETGSGAGRARKLLAEQRAARRRASQPSS
ncbi:hypothetical protein H1R20_g988, partial [Candolleomyces eurysporus]